MEAHNVKLALTALLLVSFVFLAAQFALAVMSSVTLNSPANNTNTSSTTPSFNFTAASNNATFSCKLYVDGTNVTTNSSVLNGTATIITSTALAEGARLWKVGCNDTGGEVNSSAQTINIDATAPAVTANTANNTNTSNNTPDLNFTYADNQASVASCTLFINGTARGTNSSVLNHTATVITANATLGDASVTWYVNCTDSASNVGKSATRTINVDTTGPAAAFVAPSNESWHNASFLINVTVSDALTSVSNVTYRYENSTVNGTYTSLSNTSETNWNATFDVSAVAEGNYTIRINATDALGNSNTTETRFVYVDTTAPTITFTLTPSIVAYHGTIVSNCNATDTVTPTANITTGVTGLSTSWLGPHNATCTATDLASNVATAVLGYAITAEGGSTSSGGSISGLSAKVLPNKTVTPLPAAIPQPAPAPIPSTPEAAPAVTGATLAVPLSAFGGNAGLIVLVFLIAMFAIVMYRGQKKGRKR